MMPMRKRSLLASPVLLLALYSDQGWCLVPSGWTQRTKFSSSSALLAKATTKRKKSKSSSSTSAAGGFGKVEAAVEAKPQDDYAAFPALDPDVQSTIVPFEGKNEGGDLPDEIYARLAQIYGFTSFNYLPDDKDEEPMSFSDMLMSTKDETNSEFDDLLKKPTAPASDLSDLLSIATGSKVSETPTSAPKAASSILPLSDLPPFTDFDVLNVDPLVISVHDFFTPEECDRYIELSEAEHSKQDAPLEVRSKTVGKDALAKAQRTSTTWFHHFRQVPELVAKASRLLGLDGIEHWEEPQTVRYRRKEHFTWHLDALAPSEDLPEKGGQRIVTLLVYLTDLSASDGGATMFRDLGGSDAPLRVRPKKGSSLVFFPAAGGIPNVPFDIRTLHCGEAVAGDASNDKWIAQLWLRENTYTPTAPAGNTHAAAFDRISKYCKQSS